MPELLDDRLGCHLVSCGAGTFINAKKPARNRGKRAPLTVIGGTGHPAEKIGGDRFGPRIHVFVPQPRRGWPE
jgi:hypothetical protein